MEPNGVTIVCNVVVHHEDVISVVLVVTTGSHGITSTATSSQIRIKGLKSPQLTSQTVGCNDVVTLKEEASKFVEERFAGSELGQHVGPHEVMVTKAL